MNNMKKQVKGITLVALVVTIIVLLVLSGVAISLTIGNNGIISRAKNATEKYKEGEVNEQKELGTLTNSIDYWQFPNLSDSIQVGSYVEYTPNKNTYTIDTKYNSTGTLNTDETLKWRYLGKDKNGNLLLISDKATNNNPITLPVGADTYNNLVDVIDNADSALYSNNYGTARNLKWEDIEENLKENFIQDNPWTDPVVEYGETATVTGTHTYPTVFERENAGTLGRSEKVGETVTGTGTSNGTLTFKQTEYAHFLENGFKDENIENVIIGSGTNFWLSSRGVSSGYETTKTNEAARIDFYNTVVIGNAVGGFVLYTSVETNLPEPHTYELRPVIVLNKGINIIQGKNGLENSGSIENPYRLR